MQSWSRFDNGSTSTWWLPICIRAGSEPPPLEGCEPSAPLQGYLAHTKLLPSMTLQKAYAQGPMVVLGELKFYMSEEPL